MRNIRKELKRRVEHNVKGLLHAHRDCLRNQGRDTREVTFDVMDGYYGEAFGVMRGLQILGYGKFASSNLDGTQDSSTKYHDNVQPEHNLKWWFGKLEKQVLAEEGYGGDNKCQHCKKRYGKDAASEAVRLAKKASQSVPRLSNASS